MSIAKKEIKKTKAKNKIVFLTVNMRKTTKIVSVNKFILLLLSAILYNSTVSAQNQLYEPYKIEDDKRNNSFFLVPETALRFGTYTNVEIAPQIGYYITDRWSVGAGPHYSFYHNIGHSSTQLSSTHMFGIKSFTRFSVIRNAAEVLPFYLFDELFTHIEYEKINLSNEYFNIPSASKDRIWVDYFYIGVGISQIINPRSSYFVMLLWNLDQSYFYLYNNPTYRVGIKISLK
ncbi:MAG TPA: hypothetical protein VJ951_15290 [Bacteroidales bacterium]|nr:hypothetical protein [Bacteroidales bacterium]